MTATDIARMTTEEKLEAIEMLWDSLEGNSHDPDPPDWHGEVLAGRLEAIKNGTAKFITMEELERRLGI